MNRFCYYELRTTDVDAGRAFYTTVLGHAFLAAGIAIGPLPAAALARGAVPHWLGHIRVDDVPGTAQRFIGQGATPLGPATASAAALRDPSGAVLALSSSVACPDVDAVAWHVLHAKDEQAAFAMYAGLFGWTIRNTSDAGSFAQHQAFGWTGGTQPAGIIAGSAALPGMHAHWLFFFPTADLDAALNAVRAQRGRTLPVITAYGQRLAPCEDAQGAAFGLSQRIDV
jgi:predicted enzyme related to lactoylglutathione lyase